MKLCIAGKNNIAVNAVDYMIKEKKFPKDDLIIITNKNDNGVDSWQKSLKKYAIDNNLKIVSLDQVYDIDDLLFISLEFDRIIRTDKFKTDRFFNMHFSALPKYKGMFTAVLPILNGEKQTGVTLHRMDNGIDTGDIVDQIIFDIMPEDTSHDLYFKCLDYGFDLFKKNIDKLIANKFTSRKQGARGASYYSKNEIDFGNIKIDFNKTSFEIYNQIRALIFPEYQLPVIHNEKIDRVILTNEFIGYNHFSDNDKEFIISGIDGYKIRAIKHTKNR